VASPRDGLSVAEPTCAGRCGLPARRWIRELAWLRFVPLRSRIERSTSFTQIEALAGLARIVRRLRLLVLRCEIGWHRAKSVQRSADASRT
jgi:hypothetical protein